LDFESAGPSVIKSIRQREPLNGWLALYARRQSLPQLEDYRPARFDEEWPDLVCYSVGGFELKNLMRGNDAVPRLRVVIDRELRYRPPGRILGDLIEFS
jgi:hypothetical protein